MRRWLGIAAVAAVLLLAVEVTAFVLVAQAIGLGWALLLLVVTSVLGTVLLRREGTRGWRRFRTAVGEGRPPGREGIDGLVGLVGPVLLTLPGFVTDAAGLLLAFPPMRAVASAGARRAAESRVPSQMAGQVFGPRFVRARRSPAAPDGTVHDAPVTGTTFRGGGAATTTTVPRAAIEGDIVEGEIVD
jgi:UPF0716 protein FxsA